MYKAGVSWSLFDDVKTQVNYTSARWLPSLRNFLTRIDGRFDLDNEYITPPQRELDIHLMDLVTRGDAFTEKEAEILNYCRVYLGVTTLSDISTAQGDMLVPGIEWWELDQMRSSTTGHTNHQQAPAIFFWTYWQRLLGVIATCKANASGNLAIGLNLADAYAGVGMHTMTLNTSFCTVYKTTRTNNTNYSTRAFSTDAILHGNQMTTASPSQFVKQVTIAGN
jgi:hypothetical protein